MRLTLASFIIATSLAFTNAWAGDAEAGKKKAEACASCHNADGNSETPIYPILAGQYRDYLVRALLDYRSGARNNAIMLGFASALSDEDIEDLAAWFSQQGSVLSTPDPD